MQDELTEVINRYNTFEGAELEVVTSLILKAERKALGQLTKKDIRNIDSWYNGFRS